VALGGGGNGEVGRLSGTSWIWFLTLCWGGLSVISFSTMTGPMATISHLSVQRDNRALLPSTSTRHTRTRAVPHLNPPLPPAPSSFPNLLTLLRWTSRLF